ncbi:nitrogenase component 1 [Candidatus Methanomassiliicoccus intestinalis]|uniref:Nitrogenase/oxidoreductase component 1 domain-containing protein n=1 Tax=Candidatus Methanomassiliicoccus intestinalis TaxID=1406512 RepID=A0A8J8PC98_9ARCH|nr:MAG: hypothetical protein A3207_05515 [Candidatus Methanomassiliicoccus intestinalis]
MSDLLIDLPGFAADFSGAASLLSPMGGLVVIHGPSGCMGNYTGFDEPGWFRHPGMVFSSLMRENEAILGLDDYIISKTIRACEKHNPPFVALIGSPVPALIGTDYEGIAAEIEDRTGIPTVGINTTGFDSYSKGMEKTLAVLGNRFLSDAIEKIPNLVNILGYNNLDYCGDDDLFCLRKILESNGFKINCITGRSGIEVFAQIPRAEFNIVTSASALGFAKKLKKLYDTPFTTQLPIGTTEIKETFSSSEKQSDSEQCVKNGKKFLIIGDQIIAGSLRSYLEEEYCCRGYVFTFFEFDRTLGRPEDRRLLDEAEMYSLFEKESYDVIIADPLFKRFVNGSESYIELPHPAVSSRLYWNSYVGIFSHQIKELFEQVFR